MSAAAMSPRLLWLDLRGSGLSVLERLCLEEVLLRHDDRCWAILGTHEPVRHRFLKTITTTTTQSSMPNDSCIVVMGIGGKPHELLNVNQVQQDGVAVLKRFSGGGTVVLDPSSIWTTIIGRTQDLPHVESFPRPIMQWSADAIFGPAFDSLQQQTRPPSPPQSTLVVDSKSCSPTENSGRLVPRPSLNSQEDPIQRTTIPPFELREHDYVLGERKMGGNAQAIIQGGWLHHTSFLWDYDPINMGYLTLPNKRPDYRKDRSHEDFLVKLEQYYGSRNSGTFFSSVKEACSREFQVETVTWREALALVEDQVGGLQHWFDTKSRNKIVEL